MKNIIGFNFAWIGLVYFGNSFIPIAIILLWVHLFYLSNINNEYILVVLICVLGITTDSMLQHFNIFIFEEISHIPYWLMFLWSCFSATLCHSLRFLGRSIYFQLMAGLFAPMSYIAGNSLGAVEFSQSVFITYLILAIIWSILFPLFFHLQKVCTHAKSSNV